MKKYKYILSLWILWWATTISLQAQQITQVEYWFGNDFAGAVTQSINTSNTIAHLDIPYSLTDGINQAGDIIHYRFKDSNGNWSSLITQPMVAEINEAPVQDMVVEYWFDNNFAQRKQVETSMLVTPDKGWDGQAADLDIPAKSTTINYRFKSAYNTWSPVVSALFNQNDYYNLYDKVEYWFDDDFNSRKTAKLSTHIGSDPTKINLYNNDIVWQSGKQTIHYRFYNKIGRTTPIYSYFSNQMDYVQYESIEYWFDDDFNSRKTAKLSTHIGSDPTKINLYNNDIVWQSGKQTIYYQFIDKLKRSTPVFSYNKSMAEIKNNRIVKAEYWFNDRFEERKEKVATAKAPIYIDEEDMAVALPKDSVINIRYQDAIGNWSSISYFTLKGNAGKYNIVTLQPDINNYGNAVKQYATVHQYYRITDHIGKPVEGAKIECQLKNKNIKFMSKPSSKSGIVDIAIPVFGEDVNDESDDWIGKNKNDNVLFSRLLTSDGKEIETLDNQFMQASIGVNPYEADENAYTIFFGGEVSTEIEPFSAGLGAQTAITIKNIFEDNILQGFKYSSDSNISIEGKAKSFNGASWGNFKYFGVGANVSGKYNNKFAYSYSRRLSKEPIAYLYIFADILKANSRLKTNLSSEVINYLASVLTNYLDGKVEKSTEIESFSTQTKVEAKAGVEVGTMIPKIQLDASGSGAMKYSKTTKTTKEGEIYKIQNSKIGFAAGLSANLAVFPIKPHSPATFKASSKHEKEYTTAWTDVRTSNDNYQKPIKRSLTLERNISLEGGLELPGSKNGFRLGGSKTYIEEFEFNKSLLNYLFQTTTESTGNASVDFMFGQKTNLIANPNHLWKDSKIELFNNLKGYNYTQNRASIHSDFKHITSKEYIGMGEFHQGFKADWKLLKFDFTIGGGIKLFGKYPLQESYYHFNTKEEYSLVDYADIDKASFFFAPFVYDELWEGIKESFNNLKKEIFDLWGKTKGFFNRKIGQVKEFFSNGERQYTRNLSRFRMLKSAPQKDKSILTFEIPGDEKAFKANTDFNFQYYYPGGDVLGVTDKKDTVVIISDIFFLNAAYNGKTLQTAPNGNFKLTSTVGADDLSVLDIDKNTPVSVYHKHSNTAYWKNIGAANSTIETNKLGVYALAIGINADKKAPSINIQKKDDIISVYIQDNIGVRSKSVVILVNGTIHEYNKTEKGVYTITLNATEKTKELYIDATVQDLAGNYASTHAEFNTINSDDDQDNIPNNIDKCPNTPAGQKVDANGCSQSQLDDDKDGVMNDKDKCSNTPDGQKVDVNGCSQSQLDDDKDGVMNDKDKCPNTPAGQKVDANGCSQSQLDDDKDGIPNSEDKYPNTPKDVTVDNEGGILFGGNIFSIKATSPACPGTKSGIVTISNSEKYEFTIKLGKESKTIPANGTVSFNNLASGNYTLTFVPTQNIGKAIKGYKIVVPEPKMFTAKNGGTNATTRTVRFRVSGATEYQLSVNDYKDVITFADDREHWLTVPLSKNKSLVRIAPSNECRGKAHEEWIMLEGGIKIHPKVTNGFLHIEGLTSTHVNIKLITRKGATVFETDKVTLDGKCSFDIAHLNDNIYYLLLKGDSDEFITFIYKRTF